jgi:light-regulated signal transduction histidine kinase (bacteriophytochrome)
MADPSDCAQEPIHIPGTIQPFGVLLVVSEPDMTITQVSENVSDHLAVGIEDVLGQPLGSLMPTAFVNELSQVLREDQWHTADPLRVLVLGRQFDAIVHRHDGAAILELEPPPAPIAAEPIHHPFRTALMRVQRASKLDELAKVVVQEMQRTTGFERIMFYRFHEDGSGSVDAEARALGLEPYLGLRYPASDIPAQARQLYVVNWLRLIFDADQQPARIVPPRRPDTGRPLDLSFSVLRSVSPVHIEYMKNMGVRASMSISLVVRDQLWGLISCLNHTGPRRVSHDIRSACEFLGRLVSLQIAAFEDRERLAARASRRATEEALHRAMREFAGDDVLAALAAHPTNLLSLVDAAGAAAVSAGAVLTCGRTPPREVIREIAEWLEHRTDLRPFATASLGELFPPARVFADVASGVLTFALPGGRLLWFRPEIIRTVSWGGDPTKPVDAGDRLRPRHSFALWKETVRFRALPWSASDLDTADGLQRRAIEVDIERRLAAEQRAVRARDELVAIVSHDLRGPLNVIQLQAADVLHRLAPDTQPEASGLRLPLERIGRSASRMKALVDDLLDLARIEAKRFSLDRRLVNSRDMIDDALDHARPLADAKHITLVTEARALPRLDADPQRVSQLLSNLIGNAIKFTPEGGHVTIHAEPHDGELWVMIADTGPGIAADELSHVFDRYWTSAHKGGAGLGLYIARGIVEAHGGQIWANSSSSGATLTFTLPLPPSEISGPG